MEQHIPAEVITEDRRLDGLARQSQEELARLRWHWTLDESNQERVSIRAYAVAVGRSHPAILAMVNGYAAFTEGVGQDVLTSLTDQIALASVGETKRKAAQLIADNNGIRVSNVLSHKRADVASLIATAEDAAIRRGTTVDAELERAAEIRRKAADVRAKAAEQDKARKDARYIEIEGAVAAAMRHMTHVLTLARSVALSDEHIELINDSIRNLRALLGLIDMQLVGATDVDWDAEMAKLGSAR